MAYSGYTYKMKRKTGVTDYHLGGKISTATPGGRATMTREAVANQYRYGLNKMATMRASISFNMKVQRLEDYIADYDGTNKFCFVSAEGANSGHDLYYTDGLEIVQYTGRVGRCSLNIPNRGSINVDVEHFASAVPIETTYGSDPTAIDDALLTRENVNTLTVGGISVKDDFRTATFSVNHNIQQESLGTSIWPTDSLQRATEYTIRIERALKTQGFTTEALQGDAVPVVLQINDNQTVTRKTKFTWSDAYITTHQKRISGLDMIFETIECSPTQMVLAEGT